jgi:hypothetical protein
VKCKNCGNREFYVEALATIKVKYWKHGDTESAHFVDTALGSTWDDNDLVCAKCDTPVFVMEEMEKRKGEKL